MPAKHWYCEDIHSQFIPFLHSGTDFQREGEEVRKEEMKKERKKKGRKGVRGNGRGKEGRSICRVKICYQKKTTKLGSEGSLQFMGFIFTTAEGV